ncbi:MAG: hypothetical protein C4551_08780 [Bacillota bacterium]|nr:MAG: hypothetical protein C4551_08780 [Bacillota bacterium]
MFFSRAINTEAWQRTFFHPDGSVRRRPPSSFVEAGDSGWAVGPLGDVAARPNPGKHVFATARGRVFTRLPLRTDLVRAGDNLTEVALKALDRNGWTSLRDGDIVAVSEKVVAISQGRSFPLERIHPSWPARLLSLARERSRPRSPCYDRSRPNILPGTWASTRTGSRPSPVAGGSRPGPGGSRREPIPQEGISGFGECLAGIHIPFRIIQ